MIKDAQIKAGQAVYNKKSLFFYDAIVLGISNRWIWRCPTSHLLNHYNNHVGAHHLDVGVGSGWFLDHCRFPVSHPQIALMDLNNDCLTTASARISRYAPHLFQANIFDTSQTDQARTKAGYDSVAINYLLHCLPGSMLEKAVVITNMKRLLRSGGRLFGSTLLQDGVTHSMASRKLMALYNKKGIFTTTDDSLSHLHQILTRHLVDVKIDTVGCCAIFSGTAG